MKKSTSATRSAPNAFEAYCPDVGDIIWLNLSPIRGREQDGRRPVLVLTPRSYNRVAKLCTVCAMTTKGKGYPFEVAMPDGGVILADQMRAVSWESRDSEFKDQAPPHVLADVRAKIKALLGIP